MKTERTIKKRKAKRAGRRGVSLIEILVTMFIFVLIMISSVAAFSTFFKARKTSREVQRGLEESRAALETMAKNIRMSSKLVGCIGGVPQSVAGNYTRIIMFNNTQEKCIVYDFDSSEKKLRGRFVSAATVGIEAKADPASCAIEINDDLINTPLTDKDNIINEGTVNGSFNIVPTTPVISTNDGKIGKATMKIDVISGSVASHIQTTVSFRDFEGELY